VSNTLEQVDWNAELVRGDLAAAVQELKREPGQGLFVGGVTLPLALAELGLIDEYEFVVQPPRRAHRPRQGAGVEPRAQSAVRAKGRPIPSQRKIPDPSLVSGGGSWSSL